jgi:hypothetical protein
VPGPEIEDRNVVEVANRAKHKKTFYSEFYILFYLQADHKKNSDINSLFFCQLHYYYYNFQIVIFRPPEDKGHFKLQYYKYLPACP